MLWENVIGQNELKTKLQNSISEGRISHAQLLIGPEGSGALSIALAYAQQVLCGFDNTNCNLKIQNLQHPDLHFSYPFNKVGDEKDGVAKNYLNQWREFVLQNPYANYSDWMKHLGIEKKQGIINVRESEEIVKSLSLNSYEGGYKVMIIWHAELMNTEAANKLLKIIEEPPQKTLFLLISEREDLILPTILSRCQVVKVPRLTDQEVVNYLISNENLDQAKAQQIAFLAQGNLRSAMHNLQEDDGLFDSYFVSWVRNAFMAAKKPAVLKDLIKWSNDIASWSRDEQKNFLMFCSEVFRQALLRNYQVNEITYMQIKSEGFKWDGFSTYIHGANIEGILEEINEAAYHIERNGNAKIVLFDLSIKLTRYLHKKSN